MFENAPEEVISSLQRLTRDWFQDSQWGLARGTDPETLCLECYAVVDMTIRQMSQTTGMPALACRPGCSYCCYLRVEATEVEAQVITRFLRSTRSPADRERIVEKLRQATELEASFEPRDEASLVSQWAGSNTPCPFLTDDKLCGIYAVRPFKCRGYTSLSRTACRKGYEQRPRAKNIPHRTWDAVFASAMGIGLHLAIAETKGATIDLNDGDLTTDQALAHLQIDFLPRLLLAALQAD